MLFAAILYFTETIYVKDDFEARQKSPAHWRNSLQKQKVSELIFGDKCATGKTFLTASVSLQQFDSE